MIKQGGKNKGSLKSAVFSGALAAFLSSLNSAQALESYRAIEPTSGQGRVLSSVAPAAKPQVSPRDASQASSQASWFRQRLSVLSEEQYRIRPTIDAKQDCLFAASVIERYSRPEQGLVFKSHCEEVQGVKDFIVITEVWIDRAHGQPGKAFRKLNSKMFYKNEISAQYAKRVLKTLNFHQCNVLVDPSIQGTSVSLDTVALVGSSGVRKARHPGSISQVRLGKL